MGRDANREEVQEMNNQNVKLTDIRQEVEAAGGEYRKLSAQLNSQPAYQINGVIMTKPIMIERYRLGDLPATDK